MKTFFNIFLSATISLGYLAVSQGIQTQVGVSESALVQKLLAGSSGITVTSSSLTGNANCAAVFSDGLVAVPLPDAFPDDGIILSSGGPASLSMQDSDSQSLCFNTPGDSDLDNFLGSSITRDACVLTIDFTVAEGITGIVFNYVFGSDEYQEWVNSQFNDAFALLLDGVNVALIPGTNTEVSINTVNNQVNTQFYNDNDPSVNAVVPFPNFEADGFTQLFTAMGPVSSTTAGGHSLKLVIADSSDCIYDSWVLIQGGSLGGIVVNPNTGGDPHFKTVAGKFFDFHGQCDLVFLDSPVMDLHIDIRTTVRYDYSYIESAVVRIGNSTLEVGAYGDFALDGISVTHVEDQTVSGFPIIYTKHTDKHSTFDIVVSPAMNVTLGAFKDLVSVQISGDVSSLGVISGILGDSHGHVLSREGSLADISTQDAVNVYGQGWQVAADEPMLFRTSRSPQASMGEQCILPGKASKQSLRRRLQDNAISQEKAEEVCVHFHGKSRDACIFDVMATGEIEIAAAGAY